MAPKPYENILCPYCFGGSIETKTFRHDEVHYRMATYFSPSEAEENPIKQLFQRHTEADPDSLYKRFWGENPTKELPLSTDDLDPWMLPVLDPRNPNHAKAFDGEPRLKSLGLRPPDPMHPEDKYEYSVRDVFGNDTIRRVCPYCHNPLPGGYGRGDVKFITVIGGTGAGKTVYISQLLKEFSKYAAKCDIGVFPLEGVEEYTTANCVKRDAPLPPGTPKDEFAPPVFMDIVYGPASDKKLTTLVIYDIAGESCVDAALISKFGVYLFNADAMIFLVQPEDIMTGGGKEYDIGNILANIKKARVDHAGGKSGIPIAVCVSKCDSLPPTESNTWQKDITECRDKKLFNATEYNRIQGDLCTLVQTKRPDFDLQLKLFDQVPCRDDIDPGSGRPLPRTNYNYFAVSALGEGGNSVVKETVNGKTRNVLKADPTTVRIAEPVLWILKEFGYIHADANIRLPYGRTPPEEVENEDRTLFDKLFRKNKMRFLTEEEKNRYEYEPRR